MSLNPFGDSLVNDSGKDVAGEKDTLGGFRVHDSGVYDFTISAAYAGQSAGGAKSMTFVGKLDNGADFSWTEWVTSGTAKGGKSFTVNDNGEAQYLPGYNRTNAICMLLLEKGLDSLVWETKIVKKYSKESQGEVNTEVPMAVELLGKTISLGIQKQIVNKQKQNQTTQKWEDTNEKREVNEVDKIFQAGSRRTLQEALAKQQTGEFVLKWIEANKEPRNRYKEIAGAPAAGAPGGGSDKPTTSLFS